MVSETDLILGTFSVCKKHILHIQLLSKETEKADDCLHEKTSHLIISPTSSILPNSFCDKFQFTEIVFQEAVLPHCSHTVSVVTSRWQEQGSWCQCLYKQPHVNLPSLSVLHFLLKPSFCLGM